MINSNTNLRKEPLTTQTVKKAAQIIQPRVEAPSQERGVSTSDRLSPVNKFSSAPQAIDEPGHEPHCAAIYEPAFDLLPDNIGKTYHPTKSPFWLVIHRNQATAVIL